MSAKWEAQLGQVVVNLSLECHAPVVRRGMHIGHWRAGRGSQLRAQNARHALQYQGVEQCDIGKLGGVMIEEDVVGHIGQTNYDRFRRLSTHQGANLFGDEHSDCVIHQRDQSAPDQPFLAKQAGDKALNAIRKSRGEQRRVEDLLEDGGGKQLSDERIHKVGAAVLLARGDGGGAQIPVKESAQLVDAEGQPTVRVFVESCRRCEARLSRNSPSEAAVSLHLNGQSSRRA